MIALLPPLPSYWDLGNLLMIDFLPAHFQFISGGSLRHSADSTLQGPRHLVVDDDRARPTEASANLPSLVEVFVLSSPRASTLQ